MNKLLAALRSLLSGIGLYRRSGAASAPTRRIAMVLPIDEEPFPMTRPTLTPTNAGSPVGVQVMEALLAYNWNTALPYGWFYSKSGATGQVTLHQVRMTDGQRTDYGPFTLDFGLRQSIRTPNGRAYFASDYGDAHLIEWNGSSASDLGAIYSNGASAMSIGFGLDNTVVVGSTDQSTVYERKADGTHKEYPNVSALHNYVYSIGVDASHIYCALRGDMWRLVAVNRTTNAVVILKDNLIEGADYIEVQTHFESGPYVSLLEGGVATKRWLTGGALGAVITSLPVTIVNDLARIRVDQASLALPTANLYWTPDRTATPETLLTYSTPPTAKPIFRLNRWDANKILVGTHLYGPAAIYDTPTGILTSLAAPGFTIFGVARSSDYAVVVGYPNAAFSRRTLTGAWSDTLYPGSDPLTELYGAITAEEPIPGADGRIYFLGVKERFAYGMAIGWINAQTGQYGAVDSGTRFVNFRAGWLAPVDGGRRLAITTKAALDTPSQPLPASAKLYLYNTATYVWTEYVPVPGQQTLGPISQSGNALIGMYTNSINGPTMVYRFDLTTGEITNARLYHGLICGITDNNDVPGVSHDWITGPDGFIYTVYRVPQADAPAYIVKIDPVTLAVTPIGDVTSSLGVRFYFHARDLYFTGTTYLRKLANVLPASVVAPAGVRGMVMATSNEIVLAMAER